MYHIIINPASRSGKGLKIWKKQVEPLLHEEGIKYRSYFSEKPGDVAHIASGILSSSAERPLNIILLGGDGTVNEILQGIDNPEDVILGYIPTGSSNDLARDMQLPANPAAALQLILHDGAPLPMDMGIMSFGNGSSHKFIGSSGIGFDAAVCLGVQQSRLKIVLNKIGLGKLVYLGIALRQLFTVKPCSCTITLDDKKTVFIRSVFLVACMMHRFEGGGFKFCPKADATDGIIDICAAGDIPKALLLSALPTAFFGKHFIFKGINAYRARKVHIETTAPLCTHTDGEVGPFISSVTVTCRRGCLKIMANPQ